MNVNDCWTTYQASNIHPDAAAEQVADIKAAYYSGGAAVISILQAMDPAQAVQVLESLVEEFKSAAAAQADSPMPTRAYSPKLRGEP